jgi:hypothetical protein
MVFDTAEDSARGKYFTIIRGDLMSAMQDPVGRPASKKSESTEFSCGLGNVSDTTEPSDRVSSLFPVNLSLRLAGTLLHVNSLAFCE